MFPQHLTFSATVSRLLMPSLMEKTAQETEPKSKASNEVQALYRYVMKELEVLNNATTRNRSRRIAEEKRTNSNPSRNPKPKP